MERYTATNAWGESHYWTRNSFMWGLKVCQYSLLLLVPLPWTLKPAGIILVPTVPLKLTGFLIYLIPTVANVVTEQEKKKKLFRASAHKSSLMQDFPVWGVSIKFTLKKKIILILTFPNVFVVIKLSSLQLSSAHLPNRPCSLWSLEDAKFCTRTFFVTFPSVKCCDSCTSLSRSFWFWDDLAEETSPALTQSFTL